MKTLLYIKVLAIIGITLAVYLLWQQIGQPTFKPCYVNAVVNCDAVISGPVAKTFGISTPLFGLVGYVVIFLAAQFRKPKLLVSMVTFGLVFCLWIAYRELVQLRVICPVCITCQLIMLSIFALTYKYLRCRSRLRIDKI